MLMLPSRKILQGAKYANTPNLDSTHRLQSVFSSSVLNDYESF